jgi:hypothetical protein
MPAEDGDEVYLKPDYKIGIQALRDYVECEPREVEILTDAAETERLTAARVTVMPEVVYGIVHHTNIAKRYIVNEDGKKIYVADDENVKIIRLSYCDTDHEEDNDYQEEIDLSDIRPGDKIKAYGLEICPVDVPTHEFDAYFVIVRSPPPEPEPDTVVINRNKVTFYLSARDYNKNYIINGNKVNVKAKVPPADCEDSQEWPVIRGWVKVNGNKAEFHDIWFDNDVTIRGNSAKFENVVIAGDIYDSGNNTSIDTCENFSGGGQDQCQRGYKPRLLEVEYTGEYCRASDNDQDPQKTNCEGDPDFESEVFIRASDKENPEDSNARVWFEGLVELNDTFDIDAASAGEDELKSNTWVLIYESRGGRLLQKVNFHTSCSQPLAVGDQFGSLVLKDIELVSE